MTKNPYADQSPAQVRRLIREGIITGQTSGMCEGFAQANLCMLPREYAYDFCCSHSAIRVPVRCLRSRTQGAARFA